jgi:hypothetical protein
MCFHRLKDEQMHINENFDSAHKLPMFILQANSGDIEAQTYDDCAL